MIEAVSETTSEGGAKSALVVLGMHRSGTSALSRSLSFLGYEQPSDLMRPQRDNPTGFWESDGIVSLNAAIMNELGIAWDQPKLPVLPCAAVAGSRKPVEDLIRRRHLAAAKETLVRSYQDKPRIVIKDPRICLLTDLWDTALAQSGYAVTYLLIHRDPREVAQSLGTRNNIDAPLSHQLWLRYNLAALGMLARSGPGYVVTYAELLADRHALIERLGRRLNLMATAMNAETREALGRFLDDGLRHHRLTPAAHGSSPLVPAIVRRLEILLAAWNSAAPDAQQQELAALEEVFEQHCLFAGSFSIVQSSQPGQPSHPEQPSQPAHEATPNAEPLPAVADRPADQPK
jgi:hypothetical protein